MSTGPGSRGAFSAGGAFCLYLESQVSEQESCWIGWSGPSLVSPADPILLQGTWEHGDDHWKQGRWGPGGNGWQILLNGVWF